MKVDFQFPPCRTYSASKYPPIDFAVLWGVLHNRKYTHSPANGIRYAAIRCFTKEPHRGDNYFTLFVILALQRKTGDSQPLDVKTGGIQPKLNVACFVQSCFAVADFVILSNYCLIGTRPRPVSFCFFTHFPRHKNSRLTFAENTLRWRVERAPNSVKSV